ncbi:MAG: NERD domain-containing protein [Gammaproteobacteria bacterium]|nr:NERD domain-containing protein [Gammaproteobacteria bacterium]
MQELSTLVEQDWLVTAIAVTIAVVVTMVLPIVLRSYRRDAEQRRVAKIVKNLNIAYLKNVAFPDSMDGYVFVDYLLLTPAGIVVLDLQDYNGFIFGGPNIDQWTQMVRQRGYKFENPLHQNAWRLQIIRSFVKDAPLIGKVVFSSVSQFPKGIPEGVSHVSTLNEELALLFDNKEMPEIVRKAWDELSSHAIDARSPDWKKIR